MADFICLREIELPILMSSYLYDSTASSNRYCVVAERCLIIFRRPNDLISLLRVPLNENTKLEFQDKKFTVTYLDFEYKFSNSDRSIVNDWKNALNISIQENEQHILGGFHAETVIINKIQSSECQIVIGKAGYKLLIYESFKHQKSGICRHVINLNFYPISEIDIIKNSTKHASETVTIKGRYKTFKLTFKNQNSALEWKIILRSAIENYVKSLNDRSVLNAIYKNESNKLCADCRKDNPEWVSTNLCITLCDNCVGLHRELGTGISRTQSAIIDEKCWRDTLLVQLLINIGNFVANRFWLQNVPNDGSIINIERKYKYKNFIDTVYVSLDADEIVQRLKASVVTSNVAETMRLLFSNKLNLELDVVKELIKMAKESDQALQEKFLKMQENTYVSFIYNTINVAPIFEGVFHLSYNKSDMISHLYLVILYLDRLVVKVQDGVVSTNENAVVCTIYFDYIDMVYLEPLRSPLRLSFNQKCQFLLTKSTHADVNSISVFDQSESLSKLLTTLLTCLLQNHFDPPTDETSLFLYADVSINEEEVSKCKCHLTNQNLIMWDPLDRKYDLNKATYIGVADDSRSIIINVSTDNIRLCCGDRYRGIIDCMKAAARMKELSLTDEGICANFDVLLNFIKFRTRRDGIFLKSGIPERVDRLLANFMNSGDTFLVNDSEYSVHDAIACLKRCLSLLEYPLVSNKVFSELKLSVCMEDANERRISFVGAKKMMPAANYGVLKHLMEVLYLVTKWTQTDSDQPELLVAQFMLMPLNGDSYDKSAIVKYFVDNFVVLFEYSREEEVSVLSFVDSHVSPSKISFLRTFQLVPGLKLRVAVPIIRDDMISLPFLENGVVLTQVRVQVNNFVTVGDLATHLFGESVSSVVVLWHFVSVNNKMVKRRLYCGDSVDEAIIAAPAFPDNYRANENGSFLVFQHSESRGSRGNDVAESYRCSVNIKRARHHLVMSSQDSLQVVSDKSHAVRDFKLSEVSLYRCHDLSVFQLHLLTRDSFIATFELKGEAYRDFLLNFDAFRLRNINR